MKLHESGEKYLENILILQRQYGKIRSVDLAKAMAISRPSISRAVHILERHHLLSLAEDGYITLSPAGLSYAEKLLHKHLVLLKFFLFLGADREQATNEACNIEHKISDLAVELMSAHMQAAGTPATDKDREHVADAAEASADENLAKACIFEYNVKSINCKSEDVCPFYRLAVANLKELSKAEGGQGELQSVDWRDKAQLTQIAWQQADNLPKNEQ